MCRIFLTNQFTKASFNSALLAPVGPLCIVALLWGVGSVNIMTDFSMCPLYIIGSCPRKMLPSAVGLSLTFKMVSDLSRHLLQLYLHLKTFDVISEKQGFDCHLTFNQHSHEKNMLS